MTGGEKKAASKPGKARSVRAQAESAQRAAQILRGISSKAKSDALAAVADAILFDLPAIEAANAVDLQNATAAGKPSAFLDRLTLSGDRIRALARSVLAVRELPDPVGTVLSHLRRADGLEVTRVRVPIGVVALIYEARPGVTIESAVLALKAGNATLLRPGSDAAATSMALLRSMSRALAETGLPPDSAQMLDDLRHEAVVELVGLEGLVDLAIPRGGESLIRSVTENARVPVLKHYKGVCHAYLHATASPEKAARIVVNAKCQRPGVCNALETLLVDRKAVAMLPAVLGELSRMGVEIRGDETVCSVFQAAVPASEHDWSEEYLDLILSVRVVDGLDEAIEHINRYGSKHTDVIVCEDETARSRFLNEVDSATVLVNASTRLCDGGELGLGSEIGISTDKLHARGPMGLVELTTYQWRVVGDGHIRT